MSRNHGLVGNGTAVGFIGVNGSLDWLCCPSADDPSHFSALIDDRMGGLFSIRPTGHFDSSQRYLGSDGRSAVLETRFQTTTGKGRLIDWMPLQADPIIRRHVETLEGSLSWELFCLPRFQYGQVAAEPEPTLYGICFRANSLSQMARLDGDRPIRLETMLGAGISRFELKPHETAQFSWSWGKNLLRGEESLSLSFQETIDRWNSWIHRCDSNPHELKCPRKKTWHSIYVRSEVVLRLLTHQGTGAFVESPITSLPEVLGGTQNWDQRYCWLRNTPDILQAWFNSGHHEEALRLWNWVADRILSNEPQNILPAYRVDGSEVPLELEIHQLRGHQGSRPVRIGHQSARRFQLDTAASLLQACQMGAQYFSLPHDSPLWGRIRDLSFMIAQLWRRPDHGAWDLRARPEHYLSSKLACWKGLAAAEQVLKQSDRPVPMKLRDEANKIRETIFREGFDRNRQTYTQYFGSSELDSSAFLIGLMGLQSWTEPEVVSTNLALQNDLRFGSFIKKYQSNHRSDDFDGAHLLSTLWWIASLAELGKSQEAAEILDELCDMAHPLGFLGEGITPDTGRMVGNFPSSRAHGVFISTTKRLNQILRQAYPLAKTA